LDNIARHESGLVVRQIYADKDLLTGSGSAISSRQWRQPASGNYANATADEDDAEAIYTTGKNVDNERKVYVFYGYGLAGTGPQRATSALKSVSWVWKRGTVKVIDVHQIQELDAADPQIVLFATPILLKARDNLRVEVIADTSVANASKIDSIVLMAKVIESIGQTMVG
jgi:hypothetical protein